MRFVERPIHLESNLLLIFVLLMPAMCERCHDCVLMHQSYGPLVCISCSAGDAHGKKSCSMWRMDCRAAVLAVISSNPGSVKMFQDIYSSHVPALGRPRLTARQFA